MSDNPLIDAILKEHNLVDKINDSGCTPARISGSRIVYSCPFHSDSSPSFYVFTHKENPYYHCFGCKRHGDVINFVMDRENCSLKDAIGMLAHGIDIPQNSIVAGVAKRVEEATENDLRSDSIEDLNHRMSVLFRDYLEAAEFDPLQVQFMENVFERVDKLVQAADLDTLRCVYDEIVDNKLPMHASNFFARKEQQEIVRVANEG